MTGLWTQTISESDLELGKSAMFTNMVAGDTLAISKWRYSLLGCISYTILRIAAYCIRHYRVDKAFFSERGRPTYVYFTPTCENGVRSIEGKFPGNIIGFKGRDGCNFPLRRFLLATIICFRSPALWRWIRKDRRWRPWASDVIFYILTLRWARRRFANLPRQILIFSNDHCCFDRGIVDAAAPLGHTTVYVQHAAVTDIFPSLSAQFSLLDGEHALTIYASIEGSQGTVFVCGRQYQLTGIRKCRRPTRTALVCTSTIDSIESWRPVLKAIRDAQYQVLLRTHPSDRQVPAWQRMAAEINVQWIDPGKVSLAASLEQSSIVFAGQSGVLLEAALSGSVPIIVQFDEDTARGLYDYFGFGRSRLAYLTVPKDIELTLGKVESQEKIVSTSELTYFDISYSTEIDMQQRAIEWILSPGQYENDLQDAGFIFCPKQSKEGLRVYFPRDCMSS